MITITASVGKNASNQPEDVKKIQQLLNSMQANQGGPDPKLEVDGLNGPKTIAAIEKFQTHHQLVVDGRVDPGGMALAKLNELTKSSEPTGGIDWEFISELEGGQHLKGYVPEPETSQSGVTIATGVDLGQHSISDIDALDMPIALKSKLKPYVGKIKQEAVQFLISNPLEITEAEADALDKAIKQKALDALIARYDAATTGKKFKQLASGIQTVIASVAFQYGNLAVKTPNFWKMVTEQRWQDAIAELRDFGDDYPTRRKKEAKLLEQAIE